MIEGYTILGVLIIVLIFIFKETRKLDEPEPYEDVENDPKKEEDQ